jgi:hypothetical protein
MFNHVAAFLHKKSEDKRQSQYKYLILHQALALQTNNGHVYNPARDWQQLVSSLPNDSFLSGGVRI